MGSFLPGRETAGREFLKEVKGETDLGAQGWNLLGTLHFHASDEVMRARMQKRAEKENRVDDTAEIHEKRLRDFAKESPEVIGFLKSEGGYEKVDCERDLDDVYQKLSSLLKVKCFSECFLYGIRCN